MDIELGNFPVVKSNRLYANKSFLIMYTIG